MPNFDELLIQTSRTFGLSIPLLEEPYRRRLTLAYLLFRVADTLEDAEHLPRSTRLAALRELRDSLEGPESARLRSLSKQWVSWNPSGHAGYLELLGEFPALMEGIAQLGPPARDIILRHAGRTIDGMLQFVARSDERGSLGLTTRDDLRTYCYIVAGIVGEMITELFVSTLPELQSEVEELERNAAAFGESLQLVNILRDRDDDARYGRCYLPTQMSRDEVFALAEADLVRAEAYIAALRRCSPGYGVIPFTELPWRLAVKTLELVRRRGAGAKLTRREVARILCDVDLRFRNGEQLPAGLSAHLESRSQHHGESSE